MASDLNRLLLPKLGLQSLKFRFNPVSFSSETSIVTIAGQLAAMGLKSNTGDDPAVHYLKEMGIQIPNDTFVPDIDPMSQGPGGPQIQKDASPSRQRENKSATKMKSNLNEKGVSSAGKAKTEERNKKVR